MWEKQKEILVCPDHPQNRTHTKVRGYYFGLRNVGKAKLKYWYALPTPKTVHTPKKAVIILGKEMWEKQN